MLKIVSFFLRLFLKIRYRVRLNGFDEIAKIKSGGILFLPNHPALIDPVIIGSILVGKFRPSILVTEEQVRSTILKYCVKKFHLLVIPDIGITGQSGYARVEQQLKECCSVLKAGGNVLMYPGGHIYHSRFETLKGNTGAHEIVRQCPGIHVVMVRTKGLWGSSFSRSCGYQRPFPVILRSNLKYLLQNLLFFIPRRPVEITFREAGPELPRTGTKEEFNRFLEGYYNEDAPYNTYVPYRFFEKGGIRTMPEPPSEDAFVDVGKIPPDVREKVYAKLRETASVSTVHEQDKLGTDLGMDSLMIFELLVWIQQEFGHNVNSPDSLKKVADVLLAAVGKSVSVTQLHPVPENWFIQANPELLEIPDDCKTIAETFLSHAKKDPDFPLLADQNSGVLTPRKIILAIFALKDVIAAIPGDRIGIIMPACAPFFVIFMSCLFAGKTPVILNWTVGPRNLEACVRKSGLLHILTARKVIEQLEGRGIDFSGIKEKILYLENLKGQITFLHKLASLLRSKFCWRALYRAKISETVAILFTSGSESEPKAVPLTHMNCIMDIKYAMGPMGLRQDDCILGMLPPFHSFGLLIGVMMPALSNMRTVFHSNPTEGNLLARIIGAYRPTMIVGTPTFAEGILSHAEPESVKSIRFIITGAEKCPQGVLDLCAEKCPGALFLEGYGITECGPVVALNQPGANRRNTVGHVIGCLDWMICNEQMEKLPAGQTGMLYVSGPSIFHGYLAYDGASPFVELDGKKWYRTGDLVSADEDGYVTFQGRLKRFVKIAGEMVSLPAVESVLMAHYTDPDINLPLAVEAAGPDDNPEILLFTVLNLDRNEVNQVIREAGFSPIHYIKRIVRLDEIPLLGSGKTDYRKLKTLV